VIAALSPRALAALEPKVREIVAEQLAPRLATPGPTQTYNCS